MKTIILIFSCVLLFLPGQTAGKPAQEKQNLEEIDKYISQQQSNIENYYNGQLVELNQRTQSEIRLLEVADKAVYACLAAQAEVAKTVLHIDSFGFRAPWYLVTETERMLQLKDDFEPCDDFKDSIKNSPKRFAVVQSQIAQRKSRILAQYEWQTLKLEQQKQYALTFGLAQLEKRLKEDALKPKPKAMHGMVSGIVYSIDMPSAVVGGKIVHEGDKIQGVTVVKIDKDKVEFEKKSRKWTQEVQQTPASYW